MLASTLDFPFVAGTYACVLREGAEVLSRHEIANLETCLVRS